MILIGREISAKRKGHNIYNNKPIRSSQMEEASDMQEVIKALNKKKPCYYQFRTFITIHTVLLMPNTIVYFSP